MKKLLTLLLSVFAVVGCSMDLGGEEPAATVDPLTKICPEYSVNNGSAIAQKPTCCYDADTCHVTRSGSVIASFAEQVGPQVRSNLATGEWTSSPADLPANRGVTCACLSVVPGQYNNVSGPNRCVISRSIFGGLYDHKASTICFRPNIGERAFWISGATAYGCDWPIFEPKPEGHCG